MATRYRVRPKKGVIVREGVELDSAKVGQLECGTECLGAPYATLSKGGKFRLALAAPLRGFTTHDLLDRVVKDGASGPAPARPLPVAPEPAPEPPRTAPGPGAAPDACARLAALARWHCYGRWRVDARALARVARLGAAPRAVERYAPWPLSNVLAAAVEEPLEDGLVLEFGVFSGETIAAIARALPARAVHGFDSFEGLPEHWRDGVAAGAFDRAGELPKVPDNVELVKGWFAETLPRFLEDHPDAPAAFVHVDSDLYSSAACVLALLRPRIVPGTIIVFDELMNYGESWIEDGEFRALGELEASWPSLKYEWLWAGAAPTVPPRSLRAHNGEQAALRVRAV